MAQAKTPTHQIGDLYLYFIVSPTGDLVLHSAPGKTARECWANYDNGPTYVGIDSNALRKRGYRARRLLLVTDP